jgi:hypothetical protein
MGDSEVKCTVVMCKALQVIHGGRSYGQRPARRPVPYGMQRVGVQYVPLVRHIHRQICPKLSLQLHCVFSTTESMLVNFVLNLRRKCRK